jgi:hypothetical protein
MESLAPTLNVQAQHLDVRSPDELDAALTVAKTQNHGVVLSDEQTISAGDSPRRIADFALRNRLPSIGPARAKSCPDPQTPAWGPTSGAQNLHEGRHRREPYHRRRMGGKVTGFLHIVRVDASIDPVTAEYRIAFAPVGGRLRSRHVMVHGLDRLTAFLRQAHVPTPEIERAWRALATRRIHSISHVGLTPVQIQALGL